MKRFILTSSLLISLLPAFASAEVKLVHDTRSLDKKLANKCNGPLIRSGLAPLSEDQKQLLGPRFTAQPMASHSSPAVCMASHETETERQTRAWGEITAMLREKELEELDLGNELYTNARNDTLHLLMEEQLDDLKKKQKHTEAMGKLFSEAAESGKTENLLKDASASFEVRSAMALLNSLDDQESGNPLAQLWRGKVPVSGACGSMSQRQAPLFCSAEGRRLPTMSFEEFGQKLDMAFRRAPYLQGAVPEIMAKVKKAMDKRRDPNSGPPSMTEIFADGRLTLSESDLVGFLAAGTKKVAKEIPGRIQKVKQHKDYLEQRTAEFSKSKEKANGLLYMDPAYTKIHEEMTSELLLYNSNSPLTEERLENLLKLRSKTLSGVPLTPEKLFAYLTAGDCVTRKEFGIDQKRLHDLEMLGSYALGVATIPLPIMAVLSRGRMAAGMFAAMGTMMAVETANAFGSARKECDDLRARFEVDNVGLKEAVEEGVLAMQNQMIESCERAVNMRQAFAAAGVASMGIGMAAKAAGTAAGVAAEAVGTGTGAASAYVMYSEYKKACAADPDSEACTDGPAMMILAGAQLGSGVVASGIAWAPHLRPGRAVVAQETISVARRSENESPRAANEPMRSEDAPAAGKRTIKAANDPMPIDQQHYSPLLKDLDVETEAKVVNLLARIEKARGRRMEKKEMAELLEKAAAGCVIR